MVSLSDAIQRAHILNEEKLSAGIQIPVQFDANAALLLDPFSRYAAFHGVRNCPASPKVVAAWVKSAKGNDPAKILETLPAIELLHDTHGLSNPVATAVVRAELERILQIEAPRSWPKAEQLMFASLPPEIRAVIAKRERDRESGNAGAVYL